MPATVQQPADDQRSLALLHIMESMAALAEAQIIPPENTRDDKNDKFVAFASRRVRLIYSLGVQLTDECNRLIEEEAQQARQIELITKADVSDIVALRAAIDANLTTEMIDRLEATRNTLLLKSSLHTLGHHLMWAEMLIDHPELGNCSKKVVICSDWSVNTRVEKHHHRGPTGMVFVDASDDLLEHIFGQGAGRKTH